MRALILTLALAATPVVGEAPYLTGSALQEEVTRNCDGGCVVFSQEEAREMYRTLGQALSQRAQEAYEMGKSDAQQRCASLI